MYWSIDKKNLKNDKVFVDSIVDASQDSWIERFTSSHFYG